MNKEFQALRKKQRFSLRKLNIGVASVLLGFTIFGYNLVSQAPVVHAATSAVATPSAGSSATGVASGSQASTSRTASPTSSAATDSQAAPETQVTVPAASQISAPANSGNATSSPASQAGTASVNQTASVTNTTPSAGSGASGSSATGVVSGSQASNSQAASPTGSAATDSQAAPETQVTVPATSQISAPANSGNATSSPVSQAGTVSANHTAIGKTPSSKTVSVDEATSPAVQSRILMMNLAVVNPNTEDTTLPKSTQTYTKVDQPLWTDYLTHLHDGKLDGNTWVNKTVGRYTDSTLYTIFTTTPKYMFPFGTISKGIIPSNPDKYFFAAYVDYNSSFHRVILLARSQDLNDHNLYSYTIHTGKQITSSTTAAPNTDTQEVYGGISGSKYDLIFKNYQGKSYAVILKGFEHRDGEYGLLPVFDGGLLDPTYGSNTYDQNDEAAKTKSIGSWASAIPQETSTKVRYVDQATGKDIVQPMEIKGFGYQGFKVNGEAPTVPGYNLVSKPKFLGLPYEDGTIAPYKVGTTYDLALSDSVVIKQTVINTDGTVRATAYYNGSPLLTSASKVLGRESYNDYMSFYAPDGKSYAYTNRIGQVDSSYIYYYAKDSDPKGSEMRLHFIDVTGVNNSSYAPSDGPELDADKVQTIHGNIGENYSFTYTVPTNYYEVGSSDVTGKYSGTHHDAYVYVKKQAENKSNADQYTPTVSTPTVDQNATVDPNSVVTNQDTLPKGTKYSWTTEPNTEKAGQPAKGSLHVAYPDGSSEDVPVTVNVVAKTDKSNYTVTAGQPVTLTHGQKVKAGDSLDSNAVTLKDAKGQAVSLPDGAKVVWATAPDTSEVGNGKTGKAKVVYGDQSESEAVDVIYNVVPTQADKNDAKAKDGLTTDLNKVPAAKDSVTVTDEKGNPVKDFEAEWAKDKTPDVSKPGKSTGTVAITYPDGSKETVEVPVTVRDENGQTQADKNDPKTPGNKVEVDDPAKLTDDEKKDVVKAVEDANKDDNGNSTLPDGTKITVGDNGDVTVTYPDGSEDTIPGDKVVEGKTDADKTDVTVPGTKVEVGDPTKLTDGEKGQVEEAIKDANPNLPDGTKITVADDGTATITYPDGSKDTIPGDQLVQGQKGDTTDAGNITPTIPGGKVTVKDPSHLTDDEKNQVKDNVDNANKGNFPAGTEVTVGDDGTTTVTYPDGTKDTIPGDQLVQGQKGDTTDAGNITPTIPGGKVTVKDPNHLTDDEKNQVKKNVEDANKGSFSAGTVITVGDDGTTTVTYPDGSKDVIAGTDLVIAAKSEDVLGSKHHSHKNGSNSSHADGVKGASTANGSIANAGNNLAVKGESDNVFVGVKGESDNAIGNNKATSLKTLPQTGTKDTSILGVLGMLLASLGLFVFKKKRDKE